MTTNTQTQQETQGRATAPAVQQTQEVEAQGNADGPNVNDDNQQTTKTDNNAGQRLQALALNHARTKKQLKDLQKQLQERDTVVGEYDELKKSMEADKYGFAKDKLGINYSDYTDHVLSSDDGDEEKTEIQVVLDRLKTLETMETDRKSSLEKQQQEEVGVAQQAKVASAISWAKEYVDDDERFSITKALGQSGKIVQAFWDHTQEYGETPDQEEVALKVEEDLENVLITQLKVLRGLPKFQKLFDSAIVTDTDGDIDNKDVNDTQRKNKKSASKSQQSTLTQQTNKQTNEKITTLSNKHSSVSKAGPTNRARGTAEELAVYDRMGQAMRNALNK